MRKIDKLAFRLGFEPEIVSISIASLLPVKKLRTTIKASHKYQQIARSVNEIGLVELPVVARDKDAHGRYLLLDGHLRVEILKDAGATEVECLISTDDEAFTYNRAINRLSSVQERAMIVRAMERGVPEVKIAAAMFITVVSVQRRVRMLDGICEEVVALLCDKHCPLAVFDILRKLKPIRQIEAAEFLVGSNSYSVAHANAILASTPQSQLVEGAKSKPKGLSAAALARMERELANIQAAVGAVEETFSQDNLHLMVAKGYLTKVLANERVERFLSTRYPELLEQLQAIADVTSTMALDQAA